MHKARSKSSLLSSAAPAGGAWTSSRMFRICLAGVLGALVIWQLARHSSDFPGADQRKHREDALHGQRQERGSSGSSSAQRRSAAAKAHCDLDACIELDLATQHRASSSMYGVALEDINHAIEGGLHVEMLRDWSFEARAYLAAHPELVLDTAKDVPAKPWPSHAPAMARGQSTLQQASMDPSGVASAPLLDEQAWHVSGNGIQEVMETVKRTALSELHALCIQSNSVTQTWLTNKGHTLLGFGVEGGSAYLLRARVKGASAGMSIQAALGTSDGATMFAEAKLRAEELSGSATVTRDVVSSGDPQSDDWVVLEATLRPEEARGHVSLHLTWHGPGRLCLDWVSLVPKSAMSNSGELDPFHPRLVQALTQLQPQFLRFPGGAFVEGVTLDSAYRWKLAVGPRELRPGHPNANWGYWSSDGVGLVSGGEGCLAPTPPTGAHVPSTALQHHQPPSGPWSQEAVGL